MARLLSFAPQLPRSLPAFSTAPQLPPCAHVPLPYDGPSAQEVLRLRRKHLPPALFHLYDTPLIVVEGHGQYVWDERGKRYLDGFAGIVTVHLGHAHEGVCQAVSEQMRRLAHLTTLYAHPGVALYAAELAARLPKELSVVFVVNSGSEATELALALARAATGAYDVVALRGGYHGLTSGAVGVTGLSAWKPQGPGGFGIHHALQPDAYRGCHGADGPKYAEDVADLIGSATSGRLAAFIAETFQGVGGVISLAPGYLTAVYETVRAAGGLCIADEVQSGFGRCGAPHFWGFQTQGVTPDIVTVAKGAGNGYPLAAVATSERVAASLTSRWLNTFGGSPVAAAAGRAVLRAIDQEGLAENARDVGARLMTHLRRLAERHPLIGDVRGSGLLVGVELVTDRAAKTPAARETALVLERTRQLGLLLGRGGRHANVLRITPPLCVTVADIDFLADALDRALTQL